MTDLTRMPGHLIRRLHQISAAVFSDRMRRAGVDLTPVQFAALSQAAVHPGIDQATLAGLVAYDPVTLGGVVDRLERKGLLSRSVSARDRRARVVSVTEEGAALLSQVTPLVQALQGDILSGLDDDERAALLRLLEKATRPAE